MQCDQPSNYESVRSCDENALKFCRRHVQDTQRASAARLSKGYEISDTNTQPSLSRRLRNHCDAEATVIKFCTINLDTGAELA